MSKHSLSAAPSAAEALQRFGLSRVMAKMAELEGISVPEKEIANIFTVGRILGAKHYIKKAEANRIHQGIEALKHI